VRITLLKYSSEKPVHLSALSAATLHAHAKATHSYLA
jgi:hypothetical protein